MKWILIIAAGVLCAGCSVAKPSSSEAKAAIMTALQKEGASVSDIKDFSVDGCVKAEGADGVNCDVKGTPIISMMGRQADGSAFTTTFRFKKADGVWQAFP